MENQKKIRIISREDYFKLKSYQDVYQLFINYLEVLEMNALKITNELDKNGDFILGNYTADLLNCQTEEGLLQCLSLMNIEVEKENKIIENKKVVGKVNGKKFKSGSWAKRNDIDKPIVIKDRLSLHFQNDEFLDENGVSLFEGRKLSDEELTEIMKIGMDIDDLGAMG